MAAFPWRQLLLAFVALSIGIFATAFFLGAVKIEKSASIDYKYAMDAATFGLTLVQVLLALLAIGLAALAIVGYSDIRNAAVATANRTAEEATRKYLEDWGNRQQARNQGPVATPSPTEPAGPITKTPVTEL